MISDIRVFLCDDDHLRFFGEGPCRLLHLGMAYTKALAIMRRAEKNLGFPLTARRIGGKGGGGSVLTPKAKEFLHDYETYRDACIQSSRELYTQIFSKYADGGEDGE